MSKVNTKQVTDKEESRVCLFLNILTNEHNFMFFKNNQYLGIAVLFLVQLGGAAY